MIFIAVAGTSSCIGDDDESTWTQYAEWREANEKWLSEKEATGLYERVIPAWDKSQYVLLRYFNDRNLTAGNLSPMLTSTVSVKYYGQLYDGTPFDSSYQQTDSLYTTRPGNVISGWAIALERMHVGDSVEVLVPYASAYGESSTDVIKPYSALRFGIKLVDIPGWEQKP